MRIVAVLFMVMISATSAMADPWTKTDTAFQVATSALIVADWGQTLSIADHPEKWYETNNILGEHPSREAVNNYFAANLIGNAIIARLLPNPYRRIWQTVSIVVQAKFVRQNMMLGIKMGF